MMSDKYGICKQYGSRSVYSKVVRQVSKILSPKKDYVVVGCSKQLVKELGCLL